MSKAPSDNTFRVVFRGVRGSYPVPGKATLRTGGNTMCNEVLVAGHRLIFDAGTGIISLGQEMLAEHFRTKEPMHANIFFTHVHHDHTYGFLYFKPAYFPTTHLTLVGPKTYACNIESALKEILCDPYHPVQLDEMGMKYRVMDVMGGETLRITGVGEEPECLANGDVPSPDDIVVRVCSNCRHTKLGVLHYRVEYQGKAFVFATDVEGTEDGEETLSGFAQGADLLAHDAQYTDDEYYKGPPPKKGWGHSTYRMACATAKKAGVKQLALIHHEPERDDDALDVFEKEAQAIFPGAFLAREGVVVDL